MALLNFYKGDSSRIGLETTPFSEGSFYLTEDDGALYLDYVNSITQEQIRLPITAKEEEVSDIIEKHFLIVNTVKQGNNYLLDGTTFIEIYDKFNGGNINMVCRVDGTDYIPLLSVTPSKIIFSGIYQKTSVSLDFGTDGVGVLSSTYLCASSELDEYSTKSETDNLLEAKANVENPVFSGTLGLNHNGELGFASASLGFANTASGMYCFSEGMGNQSTGDASHSEGTGNVASGNAAHAEGSGTLASNVGSHAEGANTKATGYGSHAEGSNTIASGEGQHVEGKYNVDDPNFIHIVGNGSSNSKRSNAHTLNLNGEAWFAGDVYVGSTSGTNKDDGSKKLATEEFVNTELADLLDAMTWGKF